MLKIKCKTGITVEWRTLKPVKDFVTHTFLDEWRMRECLKLTGYWCPIITTSSGLLVDGKLRVTALKQLSSEMDIPNEIPAVLVKEDAVEEYILQKSISFKLCTRDGILRHKPDIDKELYTYDAGNLLSLSEIQLDPYYENLTIEVPK